MRDSSRNIIRVLRALPALSVIAWLVTFVRGYGVTSPGTSARTVAFVAVIVTTTLALVSGAYQLPGRLRRRRELLRTPIDWEEFDRARERWRRHQHH